MIHTKADLLADGASRKKHADLMASTSMRAFLSVALLEHMDRAIRQTGPDNAAECAFRIKGAREFVDILMNLSDLPTTSKRRDLDNLKPEL